MKRLLLFFGIALALSASSFGALVEDLGAPDWRGAPGSTMQVWLFDYPIVEGQPVAPDAGFNANGTAMLEYEAGGTYGWVEQWQERFGLVPLNGSLIIDIPNFPEENPFKDIIVQVVWQDQTPYGKPTVEATMVNGQLLDPFIEADLLDEVLLDDGFYHSTYLIHLEPNPRGEQLMISGSVLVDSVVVDTICIPEPATMAILGLGALFLKRRK